MNQILITGDERVAGKVNKNNGVNSRGTKTTVPVKGSVIFYAISIIILGICLISGSVYARNYINKTVYAKAKPQISVESNDQERTATISVTHIKGIQTVTYGWNDGQETMINGRNKKEVIETIELIEGENTLKIAVTEENGQIRTFEKKFIVGNVPEIKIVGPVDNGVEIYAVSDDHKIDYIEYSWDDGEPQKIQIGKKEYEGIINAPRGQHTLKIEVVDTKGINAKLEQKIVGDTEPTLTVQSKMVNGKATFVVDAKDDEKITTVEIMHNGGEKQIIEVNKDNYHGEIIMTEGETNTLIVTVNNKNGLQKTKGVRAKNT